MNNFVQNNFENQHLKEYIVKWRQNNPMVTTWRSVPFKSGLNSIICLQSEKWLKVIEPMQDKFNSNRYAIVIKKYHKLNRAEPKDAILLNEREYRFLITVLTNAKNVPGKDVFRDYFDVNNQIIIYKNNKIGGFDINRTNTGTQQSIRLTGREVAKLLRNYKDLEDFIIIGCDEVDHPISIDDLIDSNFHKSINYN